MSQVVEIYNWLILQYIMYGYVQIPMCFTDEEDYRGNMIIEVILYQDKSRQDHKE